MSYKCPKKRLVELKGNCHSFISQVFCGASEVRNHFWQKKNGVLRQTSRRHRFRDSRPMSTMRAKNSSLRKRGLQLQICILRLHQVRLRLIRRSTAIRDQDSGGASAALPVPPWDCREEVRPSRFRFYPDNECSELTELGIIPRRATWLLLQQSLSQLPRILVDLPESLPSNADIISTRRIQGAFHKKRIVVEASVSDAESVRTKLLSLGCTVGKRVTKKTLCVISTEGIENVYIAMPR